MSSFSQKWYNFLHRFVPSGTSRDVIEKAEAAIKTIEKRSESLKERSESLLEELVNRNRGVCPKIRDKTTPNDEIQ